MYLKDRTNQLMMLRGDNASEQRCRCPLARLRLAWRPGRGVVIQDWTQTPTADRACSPSRGLAMRPRAPLPSRAFRSCPSRGQRGLPCLLPPQPDRWEQSLWGQTPSKGEGTYFHVCFPGSYPCRLALTPHLCLLSQLGTELEGAGG